MTVDSEGRHVATRESELSGATALAVGADGTMALAGGTNVAAYVNGEVAFVQSLTTRTTDTTIQGVALTDRGTVVIVGSGGGRLSVDDLEVATRGLYGFVIELALDGTPLRSIDIQGEGRVTGHAIAYDTDGWLLVKGATTAALTQPDLSTPAGSPVAGEYLLKLR